jgi:methionyl-tRNA formyltransferase
VRAFDPDPGAWTTVGGRDIKLFGPRPADDWVTDDVPGQIIEVDPALVVATGDGALQFLDVQPAGKARMSAAQWVRGRQATKGTRFE